MRAAISTDLILAKLQTSIAQEKVISGANKKQYILNKGFAYLQE
jgi:hypothetical protein